MLELARRPACATTISIGEDGKSFRLTPSAPHGKMLSPPLRLSSKTSICTPSGDSCTPPTPYGPKVALPEFQPMDTYDLNLCDSDRLLHVSMTFQRYLKWGWRKWWQKCVYTVPYWFQFNLLSVDVKPYKFFTYVHSTDQVSNIQLILKNYTSIIIPSVELT